MRISVLLPVYDGARTLGAAIESILGQTHDDLELILIDDRSTDRSAAVIASYARHDSRIRAVYHEENVGLAGTLNEGLALASSELVARMDQDDESLPERIAVQSAFMQAHPEAAVAGSFVFHMGHARRYDRMIEFPTDAAEIRATLADHNCIYHPSVMLRRREILALGGYRSEFKNAEDYDLWLRASVFHELANVPRPLIRYRFSIDGMTLGRKWEQLYYVYLAQAANSATFRSFETAEADAARRLQDTDRREFFTYVASGTLNELAALRRGTEALVAARRFGAEVGRGRVIRILLGAIKRELRGLIAPSGRGPRADGQT